MEFPPKLTRTLKAPLSVTKSTKRSQNSPKQILDQLGLISNPTYTKLTLQLNTHLVNTNRANPGSGFDILHPLGYLVLQIKINIPLVIVQDTFSGLALVVPMSLLLAHDFSTVL